MIIVDTALRAREEQGRPVRVGMIGAGFMGQGLTNQIVNSVPGMRMAAIYNRKPERALGVYRYSGCDDVVSAGTQEAVDDAIRRGLPVVAEDPFTICRSPEIDILVDVTGSVEFGAQVLLEAFRHGKSVVLMNAEVDATIGPILRVYARRHGVILSACEGDEPGVQMNLFRWVKGLGLIPRVDGQRQGPSGSLPQPDDAAGLGGAMGPERGHGHFVRGRLQDQLRAGHRGERHRLQGPLARDVDGASSTTAPSWTSQKLYDVDELRATRAGSSTTRSAPRSSRCSAWPSTPTPSSGTT